MINISFYGHRGKYGWVTLILNARPLIGVGPELSNLFLAHGWTAVTLAIACGR